ncbi:ABC transporter substrate-binding protein [Allonocardiopsis opalescens]|uniref:Osmoprotectant transport system substrate-binding protein n=1 Tax=Allonocardiopsis opalescens TaxID=1144618 RepID=A0A2T0QDU7_9ACTN|nr:ABC transporter substrate-binding protein [Allonocardiopsis opalescens]PRY02099.1 osmoprotectant transport system substrate-binding protein [Allonocardiopsis opalescens]
MHAFPRSAAAVPAVLSLLALTACGGGTDPLADPSDTGGSAGAVVVGSANFPENILLGEVYAQALEAEGVPVERQFNIGSREVYYEQIESGALSVMPEYNGALLALVDPDAHADETDEVNAALADALPEQLELLDSAEAENKDALVVPADIAERHGLAAIGDLEAVMDEITVAGPPEFETRHHGLAGLEEVYGLSFAGFTSVQIELVPQALTGGQAQAGNMFTTDPLIEANGFVILEDTENLFGAQNVTPLVHSESVDATAREALNAVSAALDTPTLTTLVAQVVTDRQDPADVAETWLTETGLAG